MSPIFIVSLVTALVAGYVCMNLSEEVPRLFVTGIAILSSILVLAFAPLTVQLLILALVLAATRSLAPSKL